MPDANLCPVCGCEHHQDLLVRTATPASQNRLYSTQALARAAQRGDLDFRRCNACRFVWNSAFDPTIPLYDKDYDNAQHFSSVFREHLRGRANRISDAIRQRGARIVVEVGCGQGDMLRMVAEGFQNDDVSFFGFDPSVATPGRQGNVTLFDEFFDATTAARLNKPADIVFSRHTIEHIHDPISFLRAIGACMSAEHRPQLFLETPDSSWIDRNGVLVDQFYEHCSLFNGGSMGTALGRSGFDMIHYSTHMGDQYLWAEAVFRGNDQQDQTLAEKLNDYVAGWRNDMASMSDEGATYVWGAGAKGLTFCNAIDPDRSRIAAVVDINPGKQGKFLPVSAHPIIAPDEIGRDPFPAPAMVVITNPVYEDEIRDILNELGIAVKFKPV
jgi:hypothetical protein